ncbi:MAG: S9 family peptidase [Acidobacteria bacterium]|nr:S9 family peptidase [Acidobacteriota bacterium]
MKPIKFFFLATCVFASVSVAQDRLLTIDDIFSADPKVRISFGGVPTRLQWTADGRGFIQVLDGKPVRSDAITAQNSPFLDTSRLRAELIASGLSTRDADRIANSPSLQFNKAQDAILINNAGDLWTFQFATGTLRRLTNTKEEELEGDFSPDGRWVSFVRANNLYVADTQKGGEKQLTRDGTEKILNGYLSWVYEEELYGRGQKRGYWWSPDSRYIAFLRLDDTKVPPFVLTNDVVTDQTVENSGYPQAGDPNPTVRLGIADVTRSSLIPNPARIPRVGDRLPGSVLRFGDAVRFVDIARYKPDDLLIARVAWTPDSRTVMFQALNREQTQLELVAASLDGKTQIVLTENTPTWVEVYDNPEFINNGRNAIWQSARNGWRHLYLYDNNGQLVRPLTSGKWEVRNFYGVDPAGQWAYFSATKDSHIAENVYRVRIADAQVERLTQGDGSHAASFNSTFTHFVHTWSDVNTPPQARLVRSDGTLERVLNENKVDVLRQFKLGTTEFLKVKTRDGFEMEAMMIKPPDFDPSKKYPVLSYTYSGPHAPAVRNGWGGSRYMWHQMMAQKGYIIWICDNRTASGKGQESVWPGYKNFMVLELRDLEDGFNYLKSQPYVDASRIGIWGWSFGGMMTSYALTHSKTFKMGMAGGTVSDWRLYDSIYTERYMGLPQNNPKGYDATSVLKAANNLTGRLLLIHGMIDDNVHMQNTTQLVFELQKAGKQFDLMLYPTARHGLTNPAQVKHWYQMMTDYVLKNL